MIRLSDDTLARARPESVRTLPSGPALAQALFLEALHLSLRRAPHADHLSATRRPAVGEPVESGDRQCEAMK